jgi:poly(glycerol-phosphate) alpha-glucosyltransferase
MKIVLVTAIVSRFAGGMFDAVRRMAQEIHSAGDEVSVFGVEDATGDQDLPQWKPLRPQLFPCRGPRSFGYSPKLTGAIKAADPAVIDVHGIWHYTSIAVRDAGLTLRSPYVVHPHGMLDPWALGNSAWKKKLASVAFERSHLQNAACLRALNRSEADSMRAFGLKRPIAIVPFGIDCPAPSPPAPHFAVPTGDLAEALSGDRLFSSGRRLALFLGRIHPKKGLPNLLHAWSLAKRKSGGDTGDDWGLAIAGWDQHGHEAELRRLVADLGLTANVTFLGPQFGAAKDAWLRRCDAFILPSHSEGLPVAVLEAWSYVKPVVMTPASNLPEGFSSDAAIRIDPAPADIARGLDSLFSMTGANRTDMGRRGRRLVEEQYSWSRAAGEMRGIYQWLAANGPAPDCIEFAK